MTSWRDEQEAARKERLKNDAPQSACPNLLAFSPRTCVGIQLKELATIRSIPPGCDPNILRSLCDLILEAPLRIPGATE